jgi:putative heme transporter
MADAGTPPAPPRVHPLLDKLAAYAWRLIVIGIALLALLWLVQRIRVVVFAIVIALFLARAVSPLAQRLTARRWRPGLAAVASMLALFVVVGGVLAVVAPAFADELGSIGTTVSRGIDDIEDWLVEDSPWDIRRSDVEQVRDRVGEQVAQFVGGSNDAITRRAIVVAEVITGAVLAIVLTFFMLRDGRKFVVAMVRLAPRRNQPSLHRAMQASWDTLAGYLRGATLLGVVEAAVIGLALFLAGGSLVIPVMIITFMSAYVPVVGAITSGVIAVLVALVSGGATAAVIVGAVAFLVQQLDNELLAPLIYGRALDLHPVVILVSVVAGAALFGITGALIAVPLVAVSVNSVREFRRTPP